MGLRLSSYFVGEYLVQSASPESCPSSTGLSSVAPEHLVVCSLSLAENIVPRSVKTQAQVVQQDPSFGESKPPSRNKHIKIQIQYHPTFVACVNFTKVLFI